MRSSIDFGVNEGSDSRKLKKHSETKNTGNSKEFSKNLT
jgi:hypothetical protein